MGCRPSLPQCFANLCSILSRVSHVSGWDDLEVGVLFLWARRSSRGPSLHNDVFIRSVARVRPSIIQGRQAEQAVAAMDCDIRRIHHIRGHGMVSADGMVLGRHLSRATRPVSGSTPIRSLRNSGWYSGRQNKQICLCRRRVRRDLRAHPLRFLWPLLCSACDRSLLFLIVPSWGDFALIGAVLELGVPRKLSVGPLRHFDPRLEDIRRVGMAVVLLFSWWTL